MPSIFTCDFLNTLGILVNRRRYCIIDSYKLEMRLSALLLTNCCSFPILMCSETVNDNARPFRHISQVWQIDGSTACSTLACNHCNAL